MSAGDTAETMDEIVDARGGESPIPAKQGDPSQDTQSQISEDDVSKSTLEQNGEENGATPAVNNSDPGGIAENLNTTKEVISRSGDECADEDSAFQIQQKHTTDAELSEVIGSENITERSNEQLVVEETAKEISASQEEINEDTSAENKELPETHGALSEANKESSEATLTEAFENEEKSLIENDDSFQKPEIEMSENQEVQNNESSVERPNVQEVATEDTGEDNLDQVTAEMKESSDEPPREENEADLNLNSPLQVAAEEDTSNKKETSSDNITEENAMQESSNLLDKRDEESACMADLYSEKPESPQNEPAETDKNTDTKDTEKSESHVDGSDSGNLDGIQISTVSGAGDSEDVVMSQEGSSEDAGKVSENAEGGETTTEVAKDIPEASDDTTKVAEVSENVSEVAGDGSKEGTTENTEKISEIPKEDEEAPSAMETEDSGSLGAMVISEPRTVSEEVMEVEQGEVTSKENPESMEVDKSSEPAPEPLEKVSEGDDKQKEGANQAEAKESASNKVENLLSENDGLGFKIVSVSAATDTTGATEEITVEDDAGKTDATSERKDKPEVEKTHQEKGKADESEADKPKEDTGPKIVATTSLSESPQRVTRSQTGSTPPAPPTAAPQPSAKLPQTCIVCKKVGKCKYNIVRNGDVKHLCNDKCFKEFRSMPTKFLRADSVAKSTPTPPKPAPAPAKASSPLSKYKTCTVCQLMNINAAKPFLCWSSMDFCGEECLGRYKKQMKSTCGQCSKVLPPSQRATFCLKVGTDVKQFCNSECYLTFKGNRKSCPWCKKDVPSNTKEQLKGYCSLSCKEKHENLDEDEDIAIIGVETKLEVPCAVCSKVTKPKHELTFEGKLHKMCSDPCYSAFQYANKLTSNTCDNCGVYCYGEGSSPQFIQFEGHQKRFCSTNCVNTFRSANKKMVQCAWCGSRKTNFDMIERVDANNKYQLFCSLNCLSLYRVNLQATSNQSVTCDQCRKFVPAQYHLTMSDASVRNFCSYSCVMTFQGQFGAGSKQGLKKPTANTANATTPAATPNKNAAPANRAVTNGPKVNETQTKTPTRANVPPPAAVAASTPTAVQSPQVRAQTVNIRSPAQIPVVVQSQQQAAKTMMTKGTQQQIIIQPPPPKQVKNKSLLCKPYVQTKATSCRPSTLSKETQTDVEAKPDEKPIFIPVPVPIYIPTPMAMYSAPTPVPLPFPVPIPIPCFIPTTKKNADSILKHIKEIREKIPDDPFEAELLRMAEAVANADKPSDDDDSDNDAPMEDTPNDAASVSEKTGETEEDMLQIALRMATEMTAPTDLETAVDPLPITDSPAPEPAAAPDTEEEEEEPPVETPRTLRRGRNRKTPKRGSSSRGSRRSKRQKIDTEEEVSESQDDSIVARSASPAVAPPAPDANFLLKYMYGVNAWKHWVVQKNAQLEKVIKQGSGRVKLFKTELLQCVADELNYSLCLFVKEVRKPNGDEYAADSILYLCLGIQNYLFENGRIDNIFTDIYYEKFTECLNEVVQRFKPKLNTAGQLVCRIEEEHLWECKQLGAHSPYVLLNTLVYFNTKHFMLRTPEDHMKLSFSHIMKHWKKSGGTRDPGPKGVGGRSVYLRYCVPASAKAAGAGGDNKKNVALEQAENLENPLRCPVKLYEFYLSKCSYFTSPESIKTRNDIFYLVPERSCVPDSPVWYSTQPMTIEPMAKMLNRIHLVKEIQEAYMKEF